MKRVCICGTSKTLKKTPRDITGLEYWILNDMYLITNKYDRLFQIHAREFLEKSADSTGTPSITALSNITVPIYMQDSHDDISNSVKYPKDEVIKYFGRELFQSSVDYMVALAIYEGYEEIYLYGVDMQVNEEYSYQKPSCSYWLGVAEGKGIKVYMPPECDLLKSYYSYGYDDIKRNALAIKAEESIKELEVQQKTFSKNHYIAMGAKDTWEYILRSISEV